MDTLNNDLKLTSNLGPNGQIMIKPIITKEKNRSLSRIKIQELKARQNSVNYRTARVLPEG